MKKINHRQAFTGVFLAAVLFILAYQGPSDEELSPQSEKTNLNDNLMLNTLQVKSSDIPSPKIVVIGLMRIITPKIK